MERNLNIAFIGSSILSAYWNGAATYYRGIVKALYNLGYHITFYEPDIYDRQKNQDIATPFYCTVVVYPDGEAGVNEVLQRAANADIIIKASGIGAYDAFLEREILNLKTDGNLVIFWDVDAPATLDRIYNDPGDPFNNLIPHYDYIFTYGGGNPVIQAYLNKGAKFCMPVYNALDTDTHHPVAVSENFAAHLSFLGNRLPDREARVEEFFLKPASLLPKHNFLLGGSGWADKQLPANVNYINHVFTTDHNTFNVTPLAVLNISRESMARYGFSPATRVFEAAGAGACIITDYWEGIEAFFVPGEEILVAHDGDDVVKIIMGLTPEKAAAIGKAAYSRAVSEHTYTQRAKFLQEIFNRGRNQLLNTTS